MRLDLRVVLLTLVVSALSALLFGLIPALQTTNPELVPALKSGQADGEKRHPLFGRSALVVARVAGVLFAAQASRTAGEMAAPLRAIVQWLDPGQPVFGVRTMEEFFDPRARAAIQILLDEIVGMGLLGLILAW